MVSKSVVMVSKSVVMVHAHTKRRLYRGATEPRTLYAVARQTGRGLKCKGTARRPPVSVGGVPVGAQQITIAASNTNKVVKAWGLK
jgi:hypothetical protein